ncbi:hypothetical protein [Oligoflexus tunisiensis]|uniref:hypothetical protein n=1 Tax=Oligoflexus tunisiensis TaxID=708132 RepID=UPI001C4019A3|nr:hypothetical protein [Oligoflexus tunisiensis]
MALLLAQTAWGETIIQPALEKLRSMFDYAPVKRIIDSQLVDEKRHERLYWQMVRTLDPEFRRLAPPRYYQRLGEMVDASPSPFALISMLHVCLESFAMGALVYRGLVCQDTAIQELDHAVVIDEQRHLAFGPTLAACLRDEQHTASRSSLFQTVREVHAVFQEDDIVEQLRHHLGCDEPVNPIGLDLYRTSCERSWMQQFKQLLRAAFQDYHAAHS